MGGEGSLAGWNVKGRQLGGRRRVARSVADWRMKRRELNITGELSFIGDASASRSASWASCSRRWASPLSFNSPMKLNGDNLAHRSVAVELHRQRLAQQSLSTTVFLLWVFLVQLGFFFFFVTEMLGLKCFKVAGFCIEIRLLSFMFSLK